MYGQTALLALPLLASTSAATSSHQAWHQKPLPSYPSSNKLGGVASETAECSQIGADFLKLGGTAADALVATVICIGVFAPYHSGIGGGGFMTVRSSNGSYEFIDFRECAPAAASENMYQGNYNGSLYGGLSSGVPGELRGLERVHQKYGKLPWADLFQPAIDYARYGFRVNEDMVLYINETLQGIGEGIATGNFLVDDPSWAIDFAPNGTLVKLDDTIYRKRYADTLETIAQYGANAFYSGAIAKATIAALKARNGTMTVADLANYTVLNRPLSQVNYRGFKLTSGTAPSSGAVTLSIMNTVSGYQDFGWPESTNISTVRLVEAMKFAYGERTVLGDPNYVPGLAQFQQNMLKPEAGAEIRGNITGYALNFTVYDPRNFNILSDSGTSQVSVADISGMAISLTTTVNLLFGSQVMVPETGVIMNDEMNDFSIPGASNAFGFVPTEANYIRAGKRPLSSISPTIVEFASNGTLYFVTGAAGGSRIITAIAQSLWRVLDRNETSYQAVAAPRLHDQLSPQYVQFETAYDNSTVAFVRDREKNVTFTQMRLTDLNLVRRLPNGTFEAAAETNQKNAAAAVA